MSKRNMLKIPQIVNVIKTPLAFLALILVIIEVFLATIAILSEYTLTVLVTMVVLFILTILLVTLFVIFRPQHLYAPKDFFELGLRREQIESEILRLTSESKLAQLELIQKTIELTKELDSESRKHIFKILLSIDLTNLEKVSLMSEGVNGKSQVQPNGSDGEQAEN